MPCVPAAGVVDIQGVCKSTVAKGEHDFPAGVVRVSDCHDSVVYALAPLQYASITCCSDCTLVVGAVGRMLRIERCERLQVMPATCCSLLS
jgi:TBCC domain-containing protein 1